MTQEEPRQDLDPFRDSAGQDEYGDRLVLGRDATLTLGTDSLIVLDEGLTQSQQSPWWLTCFGLLPSRRTLPTRAIPFYNILNATVNEYDITIHYAQPVSKSLVRPVCLAYSYDKSNQTRVANWVERLLSRSYGQSKRRKRIKILVNPFGGSGRAQKWFTRDVQPIFAAAGCELDVERTQYSGHAVEIAENLDISLFDVIASCSGDGLPYEVFNGLGKRNDAARALKDIAVVQIPCGTGNAMSLNLNGTNSPSMAALAIIKGIVTPMDLVSVTQGDTRTLSFLSQAIGIVAETDLGTENLRWMGDARFTYGFLVRIVGKTVYPCDIAVKALPLDKDAIKARHHQALQVSKEAELNDDDVALSESHRDEQVSDVASGLPPLRFGTVQDELPEDWQLTPYNNLGNFYAGNMALMSADANFFPAALPSDGSLDLLCIDGDISRLTAIKTFIAVGNGTFFDMSHVNYRKVEGFRVIPHPRRNNGDRPGSGATKEGMIAIDGESFPFKPFQVEVHRGLGTVLSKNGPVYEVPPLK